MQVDDKYVNLTDTDLIKLYRIEESCNSKAKIFNALLYRRNKINKSWHSNISAHVAKEIKKFNFCNYIDRDDLYQIVLKKFHECVINNFDIDSKFCFSTYVWYGIQTCINRIIQDFKTKKRSKELEYETVNLEDLHDNRRVADIISQNGQFGLLKTTKHEADFDQVLFYNDLIKRFKEELAIEHNVDQIDKVLMKELVYLIRNNEATNYWITEISIRYNISIAQITEYVILLTSNLEKQMFTDLLNLYECGIKDDDILVEKHKCSKDFVSKVRKKMTTKMRDKLKNDFNLSVEEIFN